MGRPSTGPATPPAEAATEPDTRDVVFLVVSHDAGVGDTRTVSAAKAKSLVARRLARYAK